MRKPSRHAAQQMPGVDSACDLARPKAQDMFFAQSRLPTVAAELVQPERRA